VRTLEIEASIEALAEALAAITPRPSPWFTSSATTTLERAP